MSPESWCRLSLGTNCVAALPAVSNAQPAGGPLIPVFRYELDDGTGELEVIGPLAPGLTNLGTLLIRVEGPGAFPAVAIASGKPGRR